MENIKKVQVLAYLTPIGFFIALYIYFKNKTKLDAFHLKQALGLHCYSFACLFIPFFIIAGLGHDIFHVLSDYDVAIWSIIVLSSISIHLFKIYIKAVISSIKGEMNLIPLFGKSYEKWFSFIN
jgi:hypothetical protein